MTNDDILDLIRRCNIRDGEELIPGNAYLFNKKFRINANGRITYKQEELIVLVKRVSKSAEYIEWVPMIFIWSWMSVLKVNTL